MRHHRRALSYMFRQFASASSSVQRLVVITVRDLATTAATGFTVAMHTGAVVTIAGTNQRLRRGGCISRPQMKAILPVLRTRVFRFRFDFRKSRLLQLLIQRRKIGLQ